MKTLSVSLFLISWVCLVRSNTGSNLAAAFAAAELVVEKRLEEIKSVIDKGYVRWKHNPFMKYGVNNPHTSEDLERTGSLFTAATKWLVERNVDPSKENGTNEAIEKCKRQYFPYRKCENTKYYTINGTCNNLRHTNYGMASGCSRRMVPPAYEDRIEAPRARGIGGDLLPNVRELSVKFLRVAHEQIDAALRHCMMTFGQFITHDIMFTRQFVVGSSVLAPDCCHHAIKLWECYNIKVSPNDTFYGPLGVTCLNFVRSIACPRCQLGHREQINGMTAFMDLSNVYGTTDTQARSLRMLDGTGRLRGQIPENQITGSGSDSPLLLPPTTTPEGDSCSAPGRNCFINGDKLVNQQIGITAWSTMFLRYHNQLALAFNREFPAWDDDTTYEVTRRICIAQMQIISYNEYLPKIIGEELMTTKKIWMTSGSRTTYDEFTDPQMTIEFSTAAFRFGHSTIRNEFENRDKITNNLNYAIHTKDVYSRVPDYYYVNSTFTVDNIVKGMYAEMAKMHGPSFVTGVTDFLFRTVNDTYGSDLPASNIHRGRDHGLAPYATYYELYFRKELTTWTQLNKFWFPKCASELPKFYRSVRDVDLYVGGLCELPISGGTVGPIFARMIADQFRDTMYGDRLFVSHRGAPEQFSDGQYEHLRETTTLSYIVCIGGRQIPTVFKDAFDVTVNDTIKCNEVPKVDPRLFADFA